MKLLPVLLLAFALSLGVACSSEPPPPAVPPTATPDVPTFSEGEAIGLVQGMLRTRTTSPAGCGTLVSVGEWSERHMGEGVWEVKANSNVPRFLGGTNRLENTWRVHEGSNAVERGEGTFEDWHLPNYSC